MGLSRSPSGSNVINNRPSAGRVTGAAAVAAAVEVGAPPSAPESARAKHIFPQKKKNWTQHVESNQSHTQPANAKTGLKKRPKVQISSKRRAPPPPPHTHMIGIRTKEHTHT